MQLLVRVKVIPTANDDGTEAAIVTVAEVTAAIAMANRIFAAADIRFVFDPTTDIDRVRSSTLLNHDATPLPNTNLTAPASQEPPSDTASHDKERNRVADLYPDRLVIFVGSGNRLVYNPTLGQWQFKPRANYWSNARDRFVTMISMPSNEILAHEFGHYLHLEHTFGHLPQSVDEYHRLVVDYLRRGGSAADAPTALFGWDAFTNSFVPARLSVDDTPPDPGMELYRKAGLDPCDAADGVLELATTFDGNDVNLRFEPDRENLMSYWDRTCRGSDPGLSGDQAARVRDSLLTRNRIILVAPRASGTAVLRPGPTDQEDVFWLTRSDLVARYERETAVGRHAVAMQVAEAKPGDIRWSVSFRDGDTSQTRVLGWSQHDFAARFDAEISNGRHATHMQAYLVAPGICGYDGIWDLGNRDQVRAIGWNQVDLIGRMHDEFRAGRRVVHLQAYVWPDGQTIRDAIWEPADADSNSSVVLGRTFQDLGARFQQESAKDRHLRFMNSFRDSSGLTLYDAVWEDGVPEQRWVLAYQFQDLLERLEVEAQDGWHLVHLKPNDVGDRQVRWDAIWQQGPADQRWLLNLSTGDLTQQVGTLRRQGYRLEGLHCHFLPH